MLADIIQMRSKPTIQIGEQMQYDWAEYIVPIGNNAVKIYIHQSIMGFSRYKFYEVSLSENIKRCAECVGGEL